jgi:hypothetical protein
LEVPTTGATAVMITGAAAMWVISFVMCLIIPGIRIAILQTATAVRVLLQAAVPVLAHLAEAVHL